MTTPAITPTINKIAPATRIILLTYAAKSDPSIFLYRVNVTNYCEVPSTGFEPAWNALEERCLSIRLRGQICVNRTA